MIASRASKMQKLLSVISAVIGIVVAVSLATSAYDAGKRLAGERTAELRISQNKDFQPLQAEVAELRKELNDIKQAIAAPPEGNERTQLARKLQQALNDLRKLQAKQERIEQAILANPGKALEIPLIQRDIETIKSAQQVTATVMKDSVDRVYDLNKWLLGGMAVSIVTLALSNLLRAGSKTVAD